MKKITLATWVTISRIALTPFVVYALLLHWWSSACILFICAAATDAIDGFLARYFNEKTFLGAALDPVADKILLFSTFFALYYINTALFHIPLWFVFIFLSKELLQVCGALVLYKKRGWIAIEANKWGKVTTLVQIVFIVWLLSFSFCSLKKTLFLYNDIFFNACIIFMSFLMIVSFLRYATMWVHLLTNGVPNKR